MSVIEVDDIDAEMVAAAALSFVGMMRFARKIPEPQLRAVEEAVVRIRQRCGINDTRAGLDDFRKAMDDMRRERLR